MKKQRSKEKFGLSFYIRYILSSFSGATCTFLADLLCGAVSHDKINRFLITEDFTPKALFDFATSLVKLYGGVLSVDDTVIEKPYSAMGKTELISYCWSGLRHKVVKGINVIFLCYTDPDGVCVIVNYRVYHKKLDGKTKNQLFREMLSEVISWGLKPEYVTGDSWYSGLDNLAVIKNGGTKAMFGLRSNRLLSLSGKKGFVKVRDLGLKPNTLTKAYLKGFGLVTVCAKQFKNGLRYYIVTMPDSQGLDELEYDDFQRIRASHWNIEQFHRAIKQLCNLGTFQVRKTKAIMNHIFCAVYAFVKLEFMRAKDEIKHWYS